MPKLSIILPLYNDEVRIQRCLDSLSNQNYQDFEVLIIDDASIDKSRVIIESHAKKDERFKIIDGKGKGAYNCRNIGLENSVGQFIGFIDSDDWVEKECFEKLVSSIETTNAQSSLCSTKRYIESSKSFENHFNFSSWPTFICMDKNYLHKVNGGLWNKVFLKKNINKLNLKFASYQMGADVLFNWMYYLSFPNVSVIHEPLYIYTMRSNSIVTKQSGWKSLETINVYKDLKNYLIANKNYKHYKKSFYSVAIRRLGQRMLIEKKFMPIFIVMIFLKLGIGFIFYSIKEFFSILRQRNRLD